MAKALYGHLGGPDLHRARLLADNATLRSQVTALTAQVSDLRESLASAYALADDRIADLVDLAHHDDLDAALREVTEAAHA